MEPGRPVSSDLCALDAQAAQIPVRQRPELLRENRHEARHTQRRQFRELGERHRFVEMRFYESARLTERDIRLHGGITAGCNTGPAAKRCTEKASRAMGVLAVTISSASVSPTPGPIWKPKPQKPNA